MAKTSNEFSQNGIIGNQEEEQKDRDLSEDQLMIDLGNIENDIQQSESDFINKSHREIDWEENQNEEEEEKHESDFVCIIANDDDLQLIMIELLLEKSGFKTISAINGQQAYEKTL